MNGRAHLAQLVALTAQRRELRLGVGVGVGGWEGGRQRLNRRAQGGQLLQAAVPRRRQRRRVCALPCQQAAAASAPRDGQGAAVAARSPRTVGAGWATDRGGSAQHPLHAVHERLGLPEAKQ